MGNQPITITARVRTFWPLTFFVFILAVVCILMIGFITYGLMTTPSWISDFIGVLILLVISGILAINYLTWQLNGQETLSLTEEHLMIYNSGTWFTNRLQLNYSEIDGIDFDNDKETPYWIKHWNIGGGKIKIKYLGRTRRFGQNLTIDEAKPFVEKLKPEIEKRKNNQQLTTEINK